MNRELPDDQAEFRKGTGTRDQIINIHWIIEKAREFQKKHLLLLYWLRQILWLCGSQQTVENSSRYGNTRAPDLRPEKSVCRLTSTVRTGHGTTDWFQIKKGVHQVCILLPCLFNFLAEYIIRNARLDEAQASVKIAQRNISNLRYADDTTLVAEREEELTSLWWRWKRRLKKLD